MAKMFSFRTAHGVWINDMRNTPFLGQEWPCITLDSQSMTDITANIKSKPKVALIASRFLDY